MTPEVDEKCCHITWNEENWILHPQRGLYWIEQDLLMVADTHFGKIKHFQHSGIPLPGEKEHRTYQRLDILLRYFKPGRLAILGDLFHSKYNSSWEEFVKWRAQYPEVGFHLIRGNHDILEELHYENLEMSMHEKTWNIENIVLTHNPMKTTDTGIQIGGHIHPGVRLKGKGKQNLRLPCFYFSSETCILPALGFFTGLASIDINKGDRVFVTTAKQVLEI